MCKQVFFFSFLAMYPAMVKETSADSEVNSKVSISQAAFLSSAMNLSGAIDGFKISSSQNIYAFFEQ